MNRLRSALALAALGAAAGAGIALVPTASALEAAAAPAWQAISAMEADAAQRSSFDAALAWLSARGPVRQPITDGDDVSAMVSLAQAWAARGDQRIERGDAEAGLIDLAEVLRHGAAIERHAHSIQARLAGADIQRLALELLAVTELEALSGAQRAELLMVLGESAVLPSPDETLQRQCALDAEQLRASHRQSSLLSADRWLTDADASAGWLAQTCTAPSSAPPPGGVWNLRGAAAAEAQATARQADAADLSAQVADNAAQRSALRERLSGGRRGR